MSTREKEFMMTALVGLVVAGLIAILMVIWAMRMGYFPPTSPTPEPTAEATTETLDEDFFIRTTEEVFWIKWMINSGYKYAQLPLPWNRPDWAEEAGLTKVGLFYHISFIEEEGSTWYLIRFEHNLLEETALIDNDSDGKVDVVHTGLPIITSPRSAFEDRLTWYAVFFSEAENRRLEGYRSTNVFERPTPDNPEYDCDIVLFDYADEIIGYLR